MIFRDNRLYLTLIGGMLVLTGTVIKNSSEQLNKDDCIGSTVFVIGWIIVAYSISMPDSKRYLSVINLNQKTVQTLVAVFSIVISTFMMKKLMSNNKTVPSIYPAMFTGGWILLGYTIGNIYGALAALFALGSITTVLPWQRQMCVVDGPGMPMFTIAWFLLAAGNSI